MEFPRQQGGGGERAALRFAGFVTGLLARHILLEPLALRPA